MLINLMRTEIDEENEVQSVAFKNLMFAHTWAQKLGPPLYQRLYPEDVGMSKEQEDELDWIIPSTQEEGTIMLQEFAAEGFDFG